MVTRFLAFVVLSGTVAAAEPRQSGFYRVVDIAGSATRLHSRDPNWKPARGLALEVGGLAVLDGNRIAVAIRKGEIWMLNNAYAEDPDDIQYARFAAGLDEPLGLMRDGDDLLTVQRTELTRLRDTNGDGVADEYLTEARGWSVSGNYHGYAYGPVRDSAGNLWVTLNLDIGAGGDNSKPWHGWALRLSRGKMEAVAAGLRSPCGLGANAAGDVFATDQQGNWIPTNTLLHLREGAYFGNPDGMAPAARPGSPVPPLPAGVEYDGVPFPEALTKIPQLEAPVVWFPYKKMGQSRTGIALDTTEGRFGPFAGQMFVGEFTMSRIGRVFLEKVGGEYQGACFPFLEGFPAAVMRLAFGRDGSLFSGMTNRGWSSIGGGSYGLQRIVWTGKTPFEAKEMRATSDGFALAFTGPVDPATAGDPRSYAMQSYTYLLSSRYGSDEIQKETLRVVEAVVSEDGINVRLIVNGLWPYYVHELDYAGVRSRTGDQPWHTHAYYTLNRIPPPENP